MNSLSDEMVERVAAIPGDGGWWKESSEGKFQALAASLLARGLSDDEAIEFLTTAYRAVANCFGD